MRICGIGTALAHGSLTFDILVPFLRRAATSASRTPPSAHTKARVSIAISSAIAAASSAALHRSCTHTSSRHTVSLCVRWMGKPLLSSPKITRSPRPAIGGACISSPYSTTCCTLPRPATRSSLISNSTPSPPPPPLSPSPSALHRVHRRLLTAPYPNPTTPWVCFLPFQRYF